MFSGDGICHTLAFPTLLLSLTASLGAAGRSLTKLPRMESQQAGILKEVVFSSDLGVSGTQHSLSPAIPKPQDHFS